MSPKRDPQYGQVMLVSGYLVLTYVNWTLTWMSNVEDVRCKPRLHDCARSRRFSS